MNMITGHFQCFETAYDGEFPLVTSGRFEGEKGAIVSNLTLPVTVEIVRHHVQKIDVFHHFGYIIPRNQRNQRNHGLGLNCAAVQFPASPLDDSGWTCHPPPILGRYWKEMMERKLGLYNRK